MSVTRRMALFFVTCGFVGYLPLMPGTWGSALGSVFVLLFPRLFELPLMGLGLICLLVVVSVLVLNGMKDTGRDPRFVVIDELIGIFITMVGHKITLLNAVVGFLLFRFFDIAKPFPVRQVERLKGGYGIVADDVLAGAYASLLLFLGEWLW
jgi:phosphatidylglycerophosphatase A